MSAKKAQARRALERWRTPWPRQRMLSPARNVTRERWLELWRLARLATKNARVLPRRLSDSPIFWLVAVPLLQRPMLAASVERRKQLKEVGR